MAKLIEKMAYRAFAFKLESIVIEIGQNERNFTIGSAQDRWYEGMPKGLQSRVISIQANNRRVALKVFKSLQEHRNDRE